MMNRSTLRVLTVVIAAIVALQLVTVALAADSWLDQPPKSWNQAGADIPTAPPLQQSQVRCQNQERPAAGTEESQLRAKGWRLESFWPATGGKQLTLVAALADYDGMCRPLQFDVFAFVNGTFAGTLSPVYMDSRTDGVLAFLPSGPNPATTGSGSINATFVRYASTDPLCCPSPPKTIVTYQVVGGVIAVKGINTEAPASLPQTGSFPAVLIDGVAMSCVALGFVVTRRFRSQH